MKIFSILSVFICFTLSLKTQAIIFEGGRSWPSYFRCADAIKSIISSEVENNQKTAWKEFLGRYHFRNGHFGEATSIYLSIYREEVKNNVEEKRLQSLKSSVIYGALLTYIDDLTVYKLLKNEFNISFLHTDGSTKNVDQFLTDLQSIAPEIYSMYKSKDDSYGSYRQFIRQTNMLLSRVHKLDKMESDLKKHNDRKKLALMNPLRSFKAEIERRFAINYAKKLPVYDSKTAKLPATLNAYTDSFPERTFISNYEYNGWGLSSKDFKEISRVSLEITNDIFAKHAIPESIFRYIKSPTIHSYNGHMSIDLIDYIERVIDSIDFRRITYKDLEEMADRLDICFETLLAEESDGLGELHQYFNFKFALLANERLFESQHL